MPVNVSVHGVRRKHVCMSVLCARCSACLNHVYIDMKACVRIAVPCCDTCAMPLSLRPRCMPCRACRCMSLCLKRIELAMLNIFIMTVQFHADRWDGCAVHAMSPFICSRRAHPGVVCCVFSPRPGRLRYVAPLSPGVCTSGRLITWPAGRTVH